MRATSCLQRGLLWGAACGLPALARTEWLAQWNAELWYVQKEGASWAETWRFAFGSVTDAVSRRRESPEESLQISYSPGACLLTMALLNLLLMCLALFLSPHPGVLGAALHGDVLQEVAAEWTDPSNNLQLQTLLEILAFICALVVIAVTLERQGFSGGGRVKRTLRGKGKSILFLMAKLSLGAPLVFLAALVLSSLYSQSDTTCLLLFHPSLIGYMLLLRWIRADQNRRCRTCMKRLSSPVHLGRPSFTLLDPNLQEYICSEGHGVMQVPAAPLMGQCAQEWLPLV